MTTFLLIAFIILTITVIGIIIYLMWLPIKIKKLIIENEQMNNVISTEEVDFEEEENNSEHN